MREFIERFSIKVESITPKERVLMAIRHQKTDRFPRGELLVEEVFLDRLYPERAHEPYIEKMQHLVRQFGLDLITVNIDDEKAVKELSRWKVETSCFVMALVDGLFWNSKDPIPFQEFILGISQGEERIQQLIRNKKLRALRLIRSCLDADADGIIIGDDLAYNRGPFVSPEDLRKWVFPGLQEMVQAIKIGNGVAFLHSCGNLTRIIGLITKSGFDGLHGLALSEGNDPLTIKQMTGKRLALMGIFELDSLKPEQIEAIKEEIFPSLAAEGGYILGSAEGLSMNTPLDSFRALYS